MQRFILIIFGSTCLFLMLAGACFSTFAQEPGNEVAAEVEKKVLQIMKEGDIPGLSLIIIRDGQQVIKNYGYSNIETREKVTSGTLFQMGSCSKAFTALALSTLLEKGKINLDDSVTKYLPWFWVQYKKKVKNITIRQLAHHTSGIPSNTISIIPVSDKPDALEKTVRRLTGIELSEAPGKQYEYATINYDVLALIIQMVAGQSFESYITQNIFDKLGLINTSIGQPKNSSLLSVGYKIGFLHPIAYEAPVYKGNNAAGYVISNATDIAEWMKIQMGIQKVGLDSLIRLTHQRDETVPLHDMAAYAMGWNISLSGNGEIYHGGLNPNYSSYIALRPGIHTGVALLTNSNSHFTPVLANDIMALLTGNKIKTDFDPGDNYDKAFTIVSMIVGFYNLAVIAFLVTIILSVIKNKRAFAGYSIFNIRNLALSLLIVLPILYAVYIFPDAFVGFTWQSMFVWAPLSFKVMVGMIICSVCISYLTYFIGGLFPEKNKFKRNAPSILLLSILSGIANMILIIVITSGLYSTMDTKHLLFYYILTLAVYLLGRKYVQTKLIRLNSEIVYDIRIKLVEKIFSTSYQRFEKMDRGRIYTALNDDVNTLADSANLIVALITSFFTAAGAFLYLASIALWATVITFLLIAAICIIYFIVSRSTNKYFEEARDTQNVFMRLVSGMVEGFKELSLHINKKLEYKADIENTAGIYKTKTAVSNIRFTNAFLIGESLLVVLLGTVVFALPRLFPGIQLYTIMGFVIILLYLIGPVTGMLNSVPGIMRMKVAWNRVRQFLKDIPANVHLSKSPIKRMPVVERLEMEEVSFRHTSPGDGETFSVGPVNLEIRQGEVLFIIGGNGSGKTTLAKLLTGLYTPDSGRILINGKPVTGSQLSEHISVVFSPFYLFEKLYNINTTGREDEIKKFLKLLDLEKKVEIKDNKYSTINLSGGQRKRLALLQCYLEDSPIYLFDEWAADQDPEYRHFFYRVLLPDMKAAGKTIIAITHDDHYFDVADKILKMNEGKPEVYSDSLSRHQTR